MPKKFKSLNMHESDLVPERSAYYPGLHLSSKQMDLKSMDVGEEFEVTIKARLTTKSEDEGGEMGFHLDLLSIAKG